MPEFRTIKEMNQWIEKTYMVDFMNRIGEEIKGMLRSEVDALWYRRAFTPQQYERTYQLLESISLSPVKKTNGEYWCKIYYDTDKIIPMDGTETMPWTRHKSIVDGESSAEAIPAFIEYGNGDSPIYQYDGVHPVQNVRERLHEDNHLLTRFKELFELKGIRCI